MSRENTKQTTSNFALDHINFAIPVSQKSAFSFGILPYSSVGYRYSVPGSLDTISVNNAYSGEGGISKAYLGYGIQRSEEHTSEPQSLMRISYAVFCLKKKILQKQQII